MRNNGDRVPRVCASYNERRFTSRALLHLYQFAVVNGAFCLRRRSEHVTEKDNPLAPGELRSVPYFARAIKPNVPNEIYL